MRAIASNAARGAAAETTACAALHREGFDILGRRLRTPLGEIDIVAANATLLIFVEVKLRASLTGAAFALGQRQQARLLGAAEYVLSGNPAWCRDDMRFDVILVDAAGRLGRIKDAFRREA